MLLPMFTFIRLRANLGMISIEKNVKYVLRFKDLGGADFFPAKFHLYHKFTRLLLYAHPKYNEVIYLLVMRQT